jgi:dihydrodipicolinate synthase/N-acetylneuraminate lyase
MERFRTVHAINVTPFRDDQGIDSGLLEKNVEFLIAGNIAPELSLTMLDGLRRGDSEAVRTVWRHVAPMEKLRAKNHNGNNVSVIKEGMNLAGLPGGLVREPLGELDEADRQELIPSPSLLLPRVRLR